MDRAPSVGRRAQAAPDLDGYDGDVEAWRTRDPVRFVGYCVSAEAGTGVPATSSNDGVGWIMPLRSVTLFVGLDAAGEKLAIDVPVARIPEQRRVPVLRAALELCDSPTPLRLCLRDDLLLLRRVSRVASLTPVTLRRALRVSAEAAEHLTDTMASWFDARPPFTEEQRASLTWASAGRARPLKSFSVAPPPRSLPPPASTRAAAPPPPAAPAPRPPPDPAWLSPRPAMGPPATPTPVAMQAPESNARPMTLRDTDGIPDILSPLFAAGPGQGSPSSRPSPGEDVLSRTAQSPAFQAALPQQRGSVHVAAPSPMASDGSHVADRRALPTAPVRRSSHRMDAIAPPPVSSPPPVSVKPPAMPELDTGELARPGLTRSDLTRSPADRLCQLLREAKALATALSFQDRSGVMVVLIRSTVFRAILEHGEVLPHAVAHLYRSTASATRDLAQAEATGRRANPVAIAEPALLVMDRIVGARGQVPEEKPLHIDPLTSASHAREHLARYLREIERAPAEPALRHFLALGALSELLVRAKLPAKTDQRLREIVAYAHRDGPRAAAIDLMMTALNRIVAQ